MVGEFQVIDTVKRHYDKSDRGPEQDWIELCVIDQCKVAPMRQMPRYRLDESENEVEKFGGGQLNGKIVKIEVREMSGKGNPTIKGKLILNGSK